MFDTEGFQNINSAIAAARKQLSKGKNDPLMKKSFPDRMFQAPFKKNKSSKKLSDLLVVRKQGKTICPLIRIWIEHQKAPISPKLRSANTPENFMNILDCYPQLHNRLHLKLTAPGSKIVKVPYSAIVQAFLRLRINNRRQIPTAMFGELCRILAEAEGKQLSIESIGSDPNSLANFIVQSYSNSSSASQNSSAKFQIYDSLYKAYEQDDFQDAEPEASQKDCMDNQADRPEEQLTLLERLKNEEAFSENWNRILTMASNPNPDPIRTQEDEILESIYVLKRETQTMVKMLEDRLMPS